MKLSRTLLALFAVAGTAQAAQLTLYKQPNFSGDAVTLRNETNDLTGSNFQDQASSVDVRSGRWQVCTQPNFQGDCTTLQPGRYASLEQSLNHRIESARPLSGYAQNERDNRYADRAYDRRFYGYDGRDEYRDNRYLDNGPRDYRQGNDESSRNWNDRYNDRSWGDRDYGR